MHHRTSAAFKLPSRCRTKASCIRTSGASHVIVMDAMIPGSLDLADPRLGMLVFTEVSQDCCWAFHRTSMFRTLRSKLPLPYLVCVLVYRPLIELSYCKVGVHLCLACWNTSSSVVSIYYSLQPIWPS